MNINDRCCFLPDAAVLMRFSERANWTFSISQLHQNLTQAAFNTSDFTLNPKQVSRLRRRFKTYGRPRVAMNANFRVVIS